MGNNWYTLLIPVLLICGVSACTSSSERNALSASASSPVFRNLSDSVQYVGRAECFSCHEDEYRGYEQHGMSRSLYPLNAETRIEEPSQAAVHDSATGLSYLIVEMDGHLYQEELLIGPDGKRVHTLRRRMDLVVGSGNAARTYLSLVNGWLYQLPVTWYSQEDKWDFSPGYRGANVRFDRRVPDRCMACHNAYPISVPHADGKFEYVPYGIDCERCHGPGALHVQERLEIPESKEGVDDSIVNPAHLPLSLRLDVCQQCHLHTTVSLLRAGRGPFDFKPGQSLAEHIALFSLESSAGSEMIGVISHADRMAQSACFRATEKSSHPLECITCHDPHEAFRSRGPEYFNETCIGCHSVESLKLRLGDSSALGNHGPTSPCFSCHMPRVDVDEAPHSSFTDHLIRVVEKKERVDLITSRESHRLVAYFNQDRSESKSPYLPMAQVVYGVQKGISEIIREGVESLENIIETDTSNAQAAFLAGFGRQVLGEHMEARPALESAVRLDPDNPERLNALAQTYEKTGDDFSKALLLYRRALAIQPAAVDIRLNYGRLLQAAGRVDDAVREYLRAIEEDPWIDKGHFNLGTAYVTLGRLKEAEVAFRKAISLNPLYAEAMGNLGSLFAAAGRSGEAGEMFERALLVAPEDPTALGNLGAFRLNQGRVDQAVSLLRQAVRQQPDYDRATANLALAYFRSDDYDSAREFAKRALDLDPSNQLARQVLVATE